MIANERVERVAPSRHGRLPAAQLVGKGAPRAFLLPLGLQGLAQRGNLLLQPFQSRICRLKALP